MAGRLATKRGGAGGVGQRHLTVVGNGADPPTPPPLFPQDGRDALALLLAGGRLTLAVWSDDVGR